MSKSFLETENFFHQTIEEISLESPEINKLIDDFLFQLEQKYEPKELANYSSYYKIKGQEVPEELLLAEDLPDEDSIARFLESLEG